MTNLAQELEELFNGAGELANGFKGEQWDAEADARIYFPDRPFCLVREWILIEVEVDDSYRSSLAADGLSPHIVFARHVVSHSDNKRQRGDWVRTTFQRSFTQGHLFESTNTVYVLLGRGVRKKAGARAVMAINNGL